MLSAFYLGLNGANPTAEDRKWATEQMLVQSGQMKTLIAEGEKALKSSIAADGDAPVPEMYTVSFAIYNSDNGMENREWDLATARRNLGACLGYILRAQASGKAKDGDLALANANLPKYRQREAEVSDAAKSIN